MLRKICVWKATHFGSNKVGLAELSEIEPNQPRENVEPQLVRGEEEPEPNLRPVPTEATNTEAVDVQRYLKKFLLFTGDMREIFADQPRTKLEVDRFRWLVRLALCFLGFMCIRGLVLFSNTNKTTALYLGHKIDAASANHLMIFGIFASIYTYYVYMNCFKAHRDGYAMFSWLEAFQVICGMRPAKDYGLSNEMLDELLTKSRLVFRAALFFAFIRMCVGLVVLLYLYEFDHFGFIGPVWICISMVFLYLNSGATYLMTACFMVLSYYLELGFEKLNQYSKRLSEAIRPLTLQQKAGLFVSINSKFADLRQEINDYNEFWGHHILISFFTFSGICLYSMYQILFIKQTAWAACILLILFAESLVLFIQICLAGARVNEQAGDLLFELASFQALDQPPYLQYRITEMVSEMIYDPVSFHCADLFAVSYEAFYLLVIGLGQNFFLLTDFITVQKMSLANTTANTTLMPNTSTCN